MTNERLSRIHRTCGAIARFLLLAGILRTGQAQGQGGGRWRGARSSSSGTSSPRPIPTSPPCGSRRCADGRTWTCAGAPSSSARSSPRKGWTTSPFNLFPAKGRYMWRDMEREAAGSGCRCVGPTRSRRTASIAARVALLGADARLGARPSPRRCIGPSSARAAASRNPAAVGAILPAPRPRGRRRPQGGAEASRTRRRLKAVGEEARSRGIFGAPTFFTEDGEMFWGNDRLEQALAWATGERARPAVAAAMIGELRADPSVILGPRLRRLPEWRRYCVRSPTARTACFTLQIAL